ncbi:WD repeat-containing protein 60 isoform X1 [Histomonas meleagridis]|uniref:WD repeat-containing protein 60 isoform X1 n=1 Tax=Histomonas meleagridis TaxID=135588 RepID=UPI00355AC8AA|nr:WD repeat-containing protein 60 isoform X1 [Histomonas meleagridis]KAH0796294.1 WD repeat-containing protein 60 isoform X1 [Histomonas meleagridis]
MEENKETTEDSPKSTPKMRRSSKRPGLSKNDISYAQSRKKYMNYLTMSPTTMIFSLETSQIKIGFSNRSTQYKLESFNDSTQTEPISYSENGIQIPEFESKPRFPSLIHFLKSASMTISTLLEQSQFQTSQSSNTPLISIHKFTTDTVPLQVETTANRTFALISDPSPLGKIVVWNATSAQVSYNLISSASPSCFTLHNEGRFVISGTESGSLLLWDMHKIDVIKEKGTSLVIQPHFSTDSLYTKNHNYPITSITSFGNIGTSVVCALDKSSIVSFWYIQNESTDVCLVKAETVKISSGFLPSFSLCMFPDSVNSFLIGSGNRIFNCCRFGGSTSPTFYHSNSIIRHISFCLKLPTIFATGCDNGKISIYNVLEADPIFEIQVNLSMGEMSPIWSPTRASVLFVADHNGMRIHIYDFLKSLRLPVFTYKVGSAAISISVKESTKGVIMAVAEGGMAVNVFRVADELSKPLSDDEMNKFKLIVFNAK